MKKILSIFAAVATLLTACHKDDNGIDPGAGGTTAGDITFRIGIGSQVQTRVATDAAFKSVFEDGDSIGIFAVRHAGGATGTALAASGNYIHNAKLTYSAADGGKWTTTSALWHATGGDVLDFYAYYPYNDHGGDPAALNPAAISFNVLADQSTAANYGHSDLLAASAANVSKGTTVALTFAHRLSLVQVEADTGTVKGSGPTEALALTLRGCKAGVTFNLGTDSLAPAGDVVAVKMLRVEKPADANYATTYTYRALVPAQQVAQNTSLCLMAQNGQLYNTPPLAAPLAFTAGEAKRYTAKLPATAIQTVKITNGTFKMGSPGAEPEHQSNETQHQVTLTKDFYMSKYEITFAQYDAFCVATSRNPPGDSGWGRGNRPVTNVSWRDAVAYCTWLSEQTGKTWQLPTEAQWEYACRAGTTTPFSLGTAGDGNSFVSTQGNFHWQYPYEKGSYPDSTKIPLGKTQPVGSYAPNAWGLYDMHGNVLEWCSDWYGDYAAGDAADPTGAATGSDRVLRGGSWFIHARHSRQAKSCILLIIILLH